MTTRSRRISLRSLLVLAVAVPAMVATAALPASAATMDVRSAVDVWTSPGNYMHDADAGWVRPVTARVTSPYGPRKVICNPVGCSNSFHDGIDFGSACGSPVKAVSPGRVTAAANAGSFGQRIIIDHGSGLQSIYGHLQTGSFTVAAGDQVNAGTIIAKVGATGVVTGCHLDLKIRVGGVFVDPKPFMALRNITL
jgi:murein DD-endopeptidase MepM/ murein hydrolase activator NlpD